MSSDHCNIKGYPTNTGSSVLGEYRTLMRGPIGSSFNSVMQTRSGIASGGSGSSYYTAQAGILPSASWWKEAPFDSHIRSFHSRSADTTWGSYNTVRMYAYDANSPSAAQIYDLEACSHAGMPCSSTVKVRSGQRLSHAWDDWTGSVVTAWSHQDRHNPVTNRQVRFSLGALDSAVVGKYYTLPGYKRASVPPAVACKSHQAVVDRVPFDCVLAYVDFDEPESRIYMQRFWARKNGHNDYDVYFSDRTALHESAAQGSAYTQSPIALWWQAGYWWIAYKRLHGDVVFVYRSEDSVDWKMELTVPHYSITGPAVSSELADEWTTHHLFLTMP